MAKFFLIGIPNSGKTTLGKRVAQSLGLPFHDTDEMAKALMDFTQPLNPFSFRVYGKLTYGQLNAVIELAQSAEPAVVATGAEAALAPDCAAAMRKSGVVIHIKRQQEFIMNDIENSKEGMVLENMKTGEKINLSRRAVELYAKELPRYEALADLTLVNDGTVDAGAEILQTLIRACLPDT